MGKRCWRGRRVRGNEAEAGTGRVVMEKGRGPETGRGRNQGIGKDPGLGTEKGRVQGIAKTAPDRGTEEGQGLATGAIAEGRDQGPGTGKDQGIGGGQGPSQETGTGVGAGAESAREQ